MQTVKLCRSQKFFAESPLSGSCNLSLSFYHLEAKDGHLKMPKDEKMKDNFYSWQSESVTWEGGLG